MMYAPQTTPRQQRGWSAEGSVKKSMEHQVEDTIQKEDPEEEIGKFLKLSEKKKENQEHVSYQVKSSRWQEQHMKMSDVLFQNQYVDKQVCFGIEYEGSVKDYDD